MPDAGWYADPDGREGFRWWDGQQWTEDRDTTGTGPAPGATVIGPAPASPGAPPGAAPGFAAGGPASTPGYAAGGPASTPGYAAAGTMPAPAPSGEPKTSGLAIASLILGIVGCSLVSIILGFIARSQIKKSNGQLKGKGMALAGILLGFFWIIASIGIAVAVVVAVEANTPSRSEFVARYAEALEDDPRSQFSQVPTNLQAEVRAAYRDAGDCAYDVLEDEPLALKAVYDEPLEEVTVFGVDQDTLDDLDVELTRCIDTLNNDIEEIAG